MSPSFPQIGTKTALAKMYAVAIHAAAVTVILKSIIIFGRARFTIVWSSLPKKVPIITVNNTSHLKYGSICDHEFLDWDEVLAIEKFYAQVALLDGYLKSKNLPSIFIRTFDVPDIDIGNWIPGSMVEWMGDCPKGPGGHPLESGHQRIAEKINEHIRNLGWLP